MSKIHFYIPIPTFIESIIVYFLLRYRKKHYGFAFRRIRLIGDKRQYAIVDPEDYQKLAGYIWQCYEKESRGRYAIRLAGRKIVSMHREIMNAPKGKIVDHRDRDGLNNTKKNLRLSSIGENNMNCGKKNRPASSKYKGVSLDKRGGKWRVCIKYNGIYKYLGCFENEEDAAKAYDAAARLYHGEFAVLNFPPSPNETPPCGVFPRYKSGG